MSPNPNNDTTTSILKNSNNQLPPLLLPLITLKNKKNNDTDNNSFVNLATLANLASKTPRIITPPPSSSSSEDNNSLNVSPTVKKNDTTNNIITTTNTTAINNDDNVSTGSSGSTSSSSSSNNKRQRSGPSCDKCRMKKIKCNADVRILYQSSKLLKIEFLHFQISSIDELIKLCSKYNIDYSKKLADTDIENLINIGKIIKHFDKIIFFKSCTSCSKKNKNLINKQNTQQCSFSKGFTRQDINTLAKILRNPNNNLQKKNIDELTSNDFFKTFSPFINK